MGQEEFGARGECGGGARVAAVADEWRVNRKG